MNLKWSLLGYSSIALLLLMQTSAAAQVDVGPLTAEGTVEAGAIPQPVPNTDVAKYQEYRDLAQQFIVPQIRLLMGDKEENYYARFDAVNASQKNQMFTLRVGDYGKLDIQAQWLEIPHAFSNDVAQTPYNESGGDFTLSSRPAKPTTGAPAGANVKSWLNSTAKPFDMSLLEGVANVLIRYTPTPSWTFNASLNYQNPTGQQPFGGSFLFGANPGTFNVNELWVPTQYHTYNFGTGVEYARNGWVLGFQYQGSFFQDVYDTLTWDNPDVWGNPAGPPGTCTNSATYSPSTGKGPCQGRAAMYPDNQAHNFIVTGAGQLPYNTRLMGSVEYGFWLQDSPFIPLTTNTALPHQSLQSVGARSSLAGDVRPFFANFTVDSNPIEPLDLKATYSYFDYDSVSPSVHFNNVNSLNEVSSTYSAIAYPYSFSQQDIVLEPTYRLTETLAAHLTGRLSTFHNGGLEVLQQDETSYGPALDWSPYQWLIFRADYQHAYRDSPGYNNNRQSLFAQAAFGNELDDLRRFDEATVRVDQTSFYAQLQPDDKIALFTGFSYDVYNYPDSNIGLRHTSSYSPSIGASYAPLAGMHFFADYSWQAYDWNLSSIQRTTDSQNPQNLPKAVWNSRGRNQGNNIDVGMDIVVPRNQILRQPSHLKFQYTYTVGNSSIHNTGDTANPGQATIYPDAGTQQQELLLRYEYELRKDFSINVGYYYSYFGTHNFSEDNLASFMPTPGSTTTSYSTFLGNRIWQPYDANVAFITLQYKF